MFVIVWRPQTLIFPRDFDLLEKKIYKHLKADEYEMAWQLGEKYLKSTSLKKSPKEYAKLCFLTGLSFYHAGKFEQALGLFDQYAKVTPEMSDHQLSRYYLYKGETLYCLGRMHDAVDILQKGILLNDEMTIERIYTALGTIYLELKQYNDASKVLNHKLNYSIKKYGESSEETAESYFWLARVYLFMKKIKLAKKFFHNSIAVLSSRPPELPIIVMAYYNLSDIAVSYDNDKVAAINYLQKANKSNQQLPHPVKESQLPILLRIKRIQKELKR